MKDVVSHRVYVSFTEDELVAVRNCVEQVFNQYHRDFAVTGTFGMYEYLLGMFATQLKQLRMCNGSKLEEEKLEDIEEVVNEVKDEIGDALDSLIDRVKDLIGKG